MPVSTTRLQFRGKIRAQIQYAIKLTERILIYNQNYHVGEYVFLSPAEVTAANTYLNALIASAAARIPKT